MISSNMPRAILCLSLAALIFTSCQKEMSGEAIPNAALRTSGVIEDDPAKVAKVPMIVSAGFQKNGSSYNALDIQAGRKPGTGGGGGGNDRKAPTITILSPANNANVSGTLNIEVSVSDNVGVSSVILSVNGTAVSSNNNTPFNLTWNASSVSNGVHTLMVTAQDAAGNSASQSIQVNVITTNTGDNTKPVVSITSPSNGASVSGQVAINISASDNVGVTSVSYSIDGVNNGSKTSAPYNFVWNSDNAAAGTHTITAIATDAAGNTNSASISVIINTVVIQPSNLPSKFELVTPTPGNQGNEGSCVPFAIAYGARSIEAYYRMNATSYSTSTNIFSPEYVYNQTKFNDCATGTSPITVLDLLKTQGTCIWDLMPYSDVNGCSLQPTTSQISNASNYKINSYSMIANEDRNAIKYMITLKHPVIATIIYDNSFVSAGPGFIWKTSVAGAMRHTLIICGYDDSKNAYKVMNSWGTSWGDGGYSWIDYDFFPQKSAYDTYVIQ